MPRSAEPTPMEKIAAAQAALILAVREANGWGPMRAVYWCRDNFALMADPLDRKTRLP